MSDEAFVRATRALGGIAESLAKEMQDQLGEDRWEVRFTLGMAGMMGSGYRPAELLAQLLGCTEDEAIVVCREMSRGDDQRAIVETAANVSLGAWLNGWRPDPEAKP